MTIRLTSPEAFDKVLENLRQKPLYDEKVNAPFFKYCVPDIREWLEKGDDEYYLDVDWLPDSRINKTVMVIRYFKRSGIPSDVEYIKEEENDRETT